jgi:hypothetical protein
MNPLSNAGILQHVFTYLPGHWLFLGAVCKEWATVYASIGDHSMVYCLNVRGWNHFNKCSSKTTLYRAAVASPAAVRLAHSCGLAIATNDDLRLVAGLHADIYTLAALRKLGMVFDDSVVDAAALSGRLNILQHLLVQQHCPESTQLSYYAARSGNVEMLMWLSDEWRCEFDESTCAGAAEAGHLGALIYISGENCEWDPDTIACCAARSENIDVMKWLVEQEDHYVTIDADVMTAAAQVGNVKMCEYLRSIDCDWNAEACTGAIQVGRLYMLRWLRENGCPWDVPAVCVSAAYFGDADILDFVIEQGEVLDARLLTMTLHAAGLHNRLQVAQWLRQHGAEWPNVLSYDQADDGAEPDIQVWNGDTLAWARAGMCTSNTSIDSTAVATCTAMC